MMVHAVNVALAHQILEIVRGIRLQVALAH